MSDATQNPVTAETPPETVTSEHATEPTHEQVSKLESDSKFVTVAWFIIFFSTILWGFAVLFTGDGPNFAARWLFACNFMLCIGGITSNGYQRMDYLTFAFLLLSGVSLVASASQIIGYMAEANHQMQQQQPTQTTPNPATP